MKRTILTALAAVLAIGTFTACETSSSDNHPQSIRPSGSGGRGMSPGQEARTSTDAAHSR